MKTVAVLGDTFLSGNVYGIQRYAYEILKQLDTIVKDIHIEIIVPEHFDVDCSFKNIKIVKFGKLKNLFLWRQICFPYYLIKYKRFGLDLTLGLSYLKTDVVCIHDCIYETYKDDFQTVKEKLKRLNYLIKVRHIVKHSTRLITVSEYSKKQLMQIYKIPSTKISVIGNAWQHYQDIIPDFKILDELGLKEGQEYFFTLGSGLPHKNLRWIVKAAMNNPKKIFVVTGNNKISNYINEIGLNQLKNVIVTGYISDQQVKALMMKARAFIHPSFCEGFGIPPLEALSTGCEILISNASCLPEIYEDSAKYFDPYDYNISITSILNEKSNSCDKVLNKYSWNKSAVQLLELLKNEIACE